MSVHSRFYAVRSHGPKQPTEDKVEISIGAYFLKNMNRDLNCIARCSCIYEREQVRLRKQPGLRLAPSGCKHKMGVLLKTHRAFRPQSAFQASPVLAVQNALPPVPKPPKPPPVTALVPFRPKPPPKGLDQQGRITDSSALARCPDPPKPLSALEVLLATPEFADCAIGGTVVGLFPAREAHILAATLLSAPQEHVTMTAFTFGEEDPGGALVVALGRAARFVSVKILADERETIKGTTKRQALCLWSLVKLGVKVELVRKSKGQQHSKSLLIGSALLLGSANWTSNSRNNHEMVLAVELNDRGRSKYYQLVGEMRSRSMTAEDFDSASAHRNSRGASRIRARSAEAARSRPMISGREEPEQLDLQMVPLLRPELLRVYPALGAASTRDASDSEIGQLSTSEPEDALGALPPVRRPKTPPIPAPEPQVQRKMKKRAVVRGNTPRETEARCPYSHPRDVD